MSDGLESTREALLTKLSQLLNSGLETEWQQRAYSSAQIKSVVTRLQDLAPNDYEAKLTVAGFTAQPYIHPDDQEIEQSCATCMYFERNNLYCNLPALALPALPQWSCVLWRI